MGQCFIVQSGSRNFQPHGQRVMVIKSLSRFWKFFTQSLDLKSSNATQMEIIKELRVENSQLKNGNSDLEFRMSKMEGDISKLTSQIQQTNVSHLLNSLFYRLLGPHNL